MIGAGGGGGGGGGGEGRGGGGGKREAKRKKETWNKRVGEMNENRGITEREPGEEGGERRREKQSINNGADKQN